jgi:hypothetical protein
MMNHSKSHRQMALLVVVAALLVGRMANADAVTDWNVKAGEIVVAAKLGTPPSNRVLAIVQTAVYEATNAITRRDPASGTSFESTPGASVEAAIAAANRVTLAKLVPSQQAAVDAAYQDALAVLTDGPAKSAGIAAGDKAALAVLALRAEDGFATVETYRPHTSPGVYVPTVIPVFSQWPQRKTWLLTGPAQFRPDPPPTLASAVWARDLNEVKEIGGKRSARRTAEQTEIVRFWESTMPTIYYGLVRSVAAVPGRDVTQNARLFAAVTQAIDDAMIAIFDAKYHYNFWRPITAIRNGDIDGNDATERDPGWTPFIETPMHPEYPCAHCIVASTVGTVLQAEIGTGPMPTLTTTSDTAKGTARSWTNIDDFVHEVADARVLDGVHYRTSTEVGIAMGKKIGEIAVTRYLRPPR